MSFLKDPAASSGEKVCVSKQELKRLIEQEVERAVKKKNRLDTLISNVQQQVADGMNYEASVKMLQTQMLELTERAEKALACISKNPTSLPGSSTLVRSHLESDSSRTASQVSSASVFMELTKKKLERISVEKAAFKEAFKDTYEQTTPSPKVNINPPSEVMKGLAKLLHIKKEPEVTQPPVETSVSVKSAKQKLPHEVEISPKRIKQEQEVVPYPPLPELPSPTSLPAEATKYSIPPRLKVDLALIKNPSPQLSVVWSVEENDPRAPPMDTYSIYLTSEVEIGSNSFDGWQKLGEHAAQPLPMFSLYTKYKPKYKICVSVVGKDKFGRYGPYSKVTCAYI